MIRRGFFRVRPISWLPIFRPYKKTFYDTKVNVYIGHIFYIFLYRFAVYIFVRRRKYEQSFSE